MLQRWQIYRRTPDVPTVDSVITYVVTIKANDDTYRPVFFVEIKPLDHVESMATRVDADKEMRVILQSLHNLIPTPRLHGISVMGQKLAFYSLNKESGYISPPEYVATDTVPKERWDLDITTEEGYAKLMEVVEDVKEMVQALVSKIFCAQPRPLTIPRLGVVKTRSRVILFDVGYQ